MNQIDFTNRMRSQRRGDAVPKRRKRHYSYDESVDEPAKLIEDEPCEVEEETPADGNEPIEQVEEDTPGPAEFEE